eukprot:6466295-Amphidinium_carterae.1
MIALDGVGEEEHDIHGAKTCVADANTPQAIIQETPSLKLQFPSRGADIVHADNSSNVQLAHYEHWEDSQH